MKFTTSVLAACLLASSVDAFSLLTTPNFRRPVTSLASTPEDEISALRAAAAKAREDADRLSKELGKTTTPVAITNAPPKKSAEELKSMLPSLIATDVAEQTDQWKDLKDSGTVSAFGSANLRTFPVSLQMLEQRTGLTPNSLGIEDSNVNLDDFKYATLGVTAGSAILGVLSLAVLPPNIGATACYFFALIPILFLGIGSSAPGIIANAIASIKGNQDESGASPQERICRHEAAHFCCGYWCGLPVAGYSVDQGVARVEFGVRNQEYDNTEVAALAVTALAGLVGEATQWDQAVGAADDLLALEQVFRKSADFMGSAVQEDVTRWGALTAANLLRENKAKYEQVVDAFAKNAPLEEAIAILET